MKTEKFVAEGSQQKQLVVVMGDVHSMVHLAAEGIEQIEAEEGMPVSQVFSVGDLGLFLSPDDWDFLTGPKKYRHPEYCPVIRDAWEAWRWPLSMIAGNHEPFHRLRDWQPDYFGGKLEYGDGGLLAHQVAGMKVAGLNGIYHPQHLDFQSTLEKPIRSSPRPKSWPEMVRLVAGGTLSRNRLTYFKETEVQKILSLGERPHLLLTHDWPVRPHYCDEIYDRRPEGEICEALQTPYACCGHHHTAAQFRCGSTEVFALNIITNSEHSHRINPGWALRFEWDGESLCNPRVWPAG